MITPQRTEVSGETRPTRMQRLLSTELCVGRQPIIDGQPSVIFCRNTRQFREALGTVDTRSRSQISQYMPLRDALEIVSPLSLPQMSRKKLEIEKKKTRRQTFEDDGMWRAQKVSRRLRNLVGRNMYKFRIISENIELVGMPKILGRVDFDTGCICRWRCREFSVKMWVFPESQMLFLVLETAKVPKNLLKGRTVAEHL